MTHFVRRNGVIFYRLECGHEVPRSSPGSITEVCLECPRE